MTNVEMAETWKARAIGMAHEGGDDAAVRLGPAVCPLRLRDTFEGPAFNSRP